MHIEYHRLTEHLETTGKSSGNQYANKYERNLAKAPPCQTSIQFRMPLETLGRRRRSVGLRLMDQPRIPLCCQENNMALIVVSDIVSPATRCCQLQQRQLVHSVHNQTMKPISVKVNYIIHGKETEEFVFDAGSVENVRMGLNPGVEAVKVRDD